MGSKQSIVMQSVETGNLCECCNQEQMQILKLMQVSKQNSSSQNSSNVEWKQRSDTGVKNEKSWVVET